MVVYWRIQVLEWNKTLTNEERHERNAELGGVIVFLLFAIV